jgi:hypothetical protein
LALEQILAMLAGVMVVVVTYWLLLPATPQVRIRLLVNRIARLTLRLGQSRSAAAAATAHRRLGATQVRLLEFVDPASGLFSAA